MADEFIDPFDYKPPVNQSGMTTQGRPGWEDAFKDPFDYPQEQPKKPSFTEGMSGPERFGTGFKARAAQVSDRVLGTASRLAEAALPEEYGSRSLRQSREARERELGPVVSDILSDPAASYGGTALDIANTALLPMRSLAGSALYNAGYQGLTGEGDLLQKGGQAIIGGGLGAAGYGLATTASKAANTARGKYGANENQVALDKAARNEGVDLSIGDLEKQGVTRAIENANPFRSRRIEAQAEELGNYLTAGGTRENILADSLKRSYEQAGQRVGNLYKKLDDFIVANNVPGGKWLPGIRADETRKTLAEIYRKYPQLIDSIPNQETKEMVQLLSSSRPGAELTFQEMDKLRKAVGKLSAYYERQASSVAPQKGVDTEAARLFKKLYSSSYKDMESWGAQSKATGDAYKMFKDARDLYKSEVLPFERFPLSKGTIHGRYDERPQDFLADLLNPRNRTQLERLYHKLDDDGKKAVQITLAADRAARKFFNQSESTIGPGGYMVGGASLFEPTAGASAAAAAYLQHRLVTNPAFKRMYFSDPTMFRGAMTQVAPQAMVGALRQYSEAAGKKQFGPKEK